jgi:type IV pilus assembly protein PilC
MTKLLINMSDFVSKTFLYFLGLVVILTIGFIFYNKNPRGAMNIARLQLKLPIFGNIVELNSASLFANTMATMIQAGLPATKAVAITAKVMPNALVRQKTANMVNRIEEGRTIVDSMREAKIYPDILTDMVGVGEETGEMKATLDTVAKYYDNELEQAVAKAIAMLEPSVLVFLAGVAGFIVISIYMAMFSMYSYM